MVSDQVWTLATLSGTSGQDRVDEGLLSIGPRPSQSSVKMQLQVLRKYLETQSDF